MTPRAMPKGMKATRGSAFNKAAGKAATAASPAEKAAPKTAWQGVEVAVGPLGLKRLSTITLCGHPD